MKIFSDLKGDYKDGYNTALNIEQYSDDDDFTVLMYGIQSGIDKKHITLHNHFKRKILLDLWSPCAFFTEPNHFYILEGFDEVYSICPYTTEWTNNKLGRKLMKYCYYPVTPSAIIPRNYVSKWDQLRNTLYNCNFSSLSKKSDSTIIKKRYDVCYVGGIYSHEHSSMIEIISKFKYIFVTQGSAKKATHRNISNSDKMNLVSQSKIGICFNKLYPTEDQILKIKSYSDWQTNKAFNQIDDSNPTCPQIKTRLHELALCKTLILCHKDNWNIIEDFYEPGKDFLYFENVKELKTLIPSILESWDEYHDIVENAYRKAHVYSTENLVKMIKEGGEFKTI